MVKRKNHIARLKQLGFLSVTLTCFAYSASAVWSFDRPLLDDGVLVLKLTVNKTEFELGEIPDFSVTLVNEGDHPVPFVYPLDGSNFGRSPKMRMEVTPPEDALPASQVWLCGNTGGISEGAFDVIPPGGEVSFPITVLGYELQRGPGVYKVQATYSTAETNIGSWLGGPLTPEQFRRMRNQFGRLLSKVPRYTVASNFVEFEVKWPYASDAEALQSGPSVDALFAYRRVMAKGSNDDTRSQILDAYIRIMEEGGFGHWTNFMNEVTAHLSQTASAKEAIRVWESFAAKADTDVTFRFNGDVGFEVDFIALLMRLPEDMRYEALLQGFSPRYRRSMIEPRDELLEVIDRDSSVDMSNTLKTLYARWHDDARVRSGIGRLLYRRGFDLEVLDEQR